MIPKKIKICPVCGEEFKSREGKKTCSNSCRTALYRILQEGGTPSFFLIAKSKSQGKPLVFATPKKKEKKIQKPENELNTIINYKASSENSYDRPPLSVMLMDEAGMFHVPEVTLTKEQKATEKAKIQAEITKIKAEKSPMGGHPKTFVLNQQMKISNLEDKLKLYE